MLPPTRASKTMDANGACKMWWSGDHQPAMSSVKTANACSTGASTTMEVWTAVDRVSLIARVLSLFPLFLFDSGLERQQRRGPEALEVVPQPGEAVRVQAVDAARPDLYTAHESGVLQDLEVLGDGGPADRQQRGEVDDGGGPLSELLEDGPPGRIAQGAEGRRVSIHLR